MSNLMAEPEEKPVELDEDQIKRFGDTNLDFIILGSEEKK